MKQNLENVTNKVGGPGATDKVEGKILEVGGHVKEAAGNLTGNEKLEAEGKADQVKGIGKQWVGEVKEKAASAVDHVVGGAKAVVETAKEMKDGKDCKDGKSGP